MDKVIKNEKINFDKILVKQNCNQAKQLWNSITIKLGKNKKTTNKTVYIQGIDNLKISAKNEKANRMKSHYYKVGDSLSKNIRNPLNNNIKQPPMCTNTIFLHLRIILKFKI